MGASASGITSNPAWQLAQPFFDLLAVAVLVWMTVLVVRKYFKGEHHNIMIQVLFGMIALIFLIDPTVFFGVLNWLIGKLPHS
jgi:nitric oxide reductase large subunit